MMDPIGYLDGNRTQFWLVAADARVLAKWDGNETGDYDRALEIINEGDETKIAIGDASGLVIDVGEAGGSRVWPIDGGIALWTYRSALDVSRTDPEVLRKLGKKIAELPVHGVPIEIGVLDVPSGCLGLTVPFAPGLAIEDVEATIASGQPLGDTGRLLVPVPAGRYVVVSEPLAGSFSAWHEDELGQYQNRIRITRTL
jgi:hypothetical protein